MDDTDANHASAWAPGQRVRGATRANLAGALGQVWAVCGAPGSVLLTLFLQEYLHADKWYIGLVLAMTYLGPTFELPGAALTEWLGCRRRIFVVTHLLNRAAFFVLAVVPLVSTAEAGRDRGIVLVLLVVGTTRVIAHLGAPAWWSWMADLVPERSRGEFFSCRQRWANVSSASTFVVSMALLHWGGGMGNRVLVSVLFAIGAAFGVADILLYLRVPEPARAPTPDRLGEGRLTAFLGPFRQPGYRRLLVGMGLWSFAANLVLPFVPVYQRGEELAGRSVGLGISWLMLAVLNVAGSLAAAASSRWWAVWISRRGSCSLLLFGSGHLLVLAAYLVMDRTWGLVVLLPLTLVQGGLTTAWTVASQQLMLNLSPRSRRSFFVSVYNVTTGWLMALSPLLAGLVADRWKVLDATLSNGLPVCYFHVLLVAALAGALIALAVLAGLPADGPPRPSNRPGLLRWGWVRLLPRLGWGTWLMLPRIVVPFPDPLAPRRGGQRASQVASEADAASIQ
ncbi:MAG: MFS transporter [Gemmataceae bacterium]|nr:MFS transporter [Gemmataceae bacterium]MDW8266009.1 MFS transporter [Gemmataceae bacterium]